MSKNVQVSSTKSIQTTANKTITVNGHNLVDTAPDGTTYVAIKGAQIPDSVDLNTRFSWALQSEVEVPSEVVRTVSFSNDGNTYGYIQNELIKIVSGTASFDIVPSSIHTDSVLTLSGKGDQCILSHAGGCDVYKLDLDTMSVSTVHELPVVYKDGDQRDENKCIIYSTDKQFRTVVMIDTSFVRDGSKNGMIQYVFYSDFQEYKMVKVNSEYFISPIVRGGSINIEEGTLYANGFYNPLKPAGVYVSVSDYDRNYIASIYPFNINDETIGCASYNMRYVNTYAISPSDNSRFISSYYGDKFAYLIDNGDIRVYDRRTNRFIGEPIDTSGQEVTSIHLSASAKTMCFTVSTGSTYIYNINPGYQDWQWVGDIHAGRAIPGTAKYLSFTGDKLIVIDGDKMNTYTFPYANMDPSQISGTWRNEGFKTYINTEIKEATNTDFLDTVFGNIHVPLAKFSENNIHTELTKVYRGNQLIQQLDDNNTTIRSVSLSPNGRYYTIRNHTQNIIRYDLNTDNIESSALTIGTSKSDYFTVRDDGRVFVVDEINSTTVRLTLFDTDGNAIRSYDHVNERNYTYMNTISISDESSTLIVGFAEDSDRGNYKTSTRVVVFDTETPDADPRVIEIPRNKFSIFNRTLPTYGISGDCNTIAI